MIDLAGFVDVAVKSAAVAALALLAARALRRRSAAERSAVLHGGLVALALLPVLMAFAPRWQVALAVLPAQPVVEEATVLRTAVPVRGEPVESRPRAAAHEPLLTPANLIGLAYSLPALALLMTLALSISRLRALRNRARPVRDARWDAALAAAKARTGFHGYVSLLQSPDVASPLSFGWHDRVIVLDAAGDGDDFDRDSAVALLAHELAHLARHDWGKLVFARVVTAVFWFNPLAWSLARQCHQLREEAADDAVLRGDIAGVDYADLLLRFARAQGPQPRLAAHAIFAGRDAHRHLARRLARVLADHEARAPAMRAWSFGSALLATVIALPVAAIAPQLRPAPSAEAAPVPDPRPRPVIAVATASVDATVSLDATTVDIASGLVQLALGVDDGLDDAPPAKPGEITFAIGPSRRDDPGIVQLSIVEHLARGRSMNSGPHRLDAMDGLDRGALAGSAPRTVQFRLVREAGTLTCEGPAATDRATGTCRFAPDATFMRELERRGLGRADARQQLHLALQGASLATLDELARRGYETPTIERFIETAIHGVTVEWMRSLDRVGLRLDSVARLVEFRIHDIDADYIERLQKAGFTDLTPQQLLEFRIHDVTPESVAALAAIGFDDLSPREIVTLHIHDITPAFAREMRAAGYPDLTVEQLLNFRIHEVTPAFVKDMGALGYAKLPADDLVAFKIHDVTPAFVREVNALGYANVDADDLVAMRVHDITPAWMRTQLAANGPRPSIDDLVERRIFED